MDKELECGWGKTQNLLPQKQGHRSSINQVYSEEFDSLCLSSRFAQRASRLEKLIIKIGNVTLPSEL